MFGPQQRQSVSAFEGNGTVPLGVIGSGFKSVKRRALQVQAQLEDTR